ncbi:MAG: ribosomal protection-like ABC-F family protein [Fastidiosipilaceae bacterium]|jgi:ATP-binding cassette subfamily F protein 3
MIKYSTMSILSVENISKSYFGKNLLQTTSLSVTKGDRVALIGENGTGKTTLLRMIAGEEDPDGGRVVVSSGALIGYLTQHTEEMGDLRESSLECGRLSALEDQIRQLENEMACFSDSAAEGYKTVMQQYNRATAEFEAADGYTYRARMAAALAGLGLTGDSLHRPLAGLSGGERMRTAMARLLINEPDILLLDEPTNHLDIDAIEWLEDYIRRYSGTVLFISHDRSFINNTATTVCELRGAKLHTYPGDYTAYLAQKEIEQDFARQQVKRLDEEIERQKQVVQTLLSHRDMSGYHDREKVVEKLSDKLAAARGQIAASAKRMNFHFIPETKTGDPQRVILQAVSLTKQFDERSLFVDVNLELTASQKLFIAGPNGCGKSTLIKVLTGADDRFTGTVTISDAVTFAEMGQFVEFDDENRTLLEELLAHSELSETAARNLLARFGFRDVEVFKEINVLSGGERSRLYLCRLLEERPDLLFLDEPTNHLDINSREILEQALADYPGAILGISHDRYFVDRCADTVAGFIGHDVCLFDSFEHYRTKERLHRRDQRELKARERAEAVAKERTDKNQQSANRAEQRRNVARLKEERSKLERRIAALEDEKQQIESDLGVDTEPRTYVRLAQIESETETAYERLFELEEQL